MKVLCLCQAGVVRSGAMAYILKYHFETDAIAASLECNSSHTLAHLVEWADHVLLMDKKLKSLYLNRGLGEEKLVLCDVGEDRWKNPFHPDLLGIVHQWAIAFVPQLKRSIPRKILVSA